ncbi:phage tail sheath family protein [Caulobacter endophyticus]|uniref:phage tail sheath family protein n=1 Tax=Caulobacter endophyticus TaxID=2172652 RepID=UPI00240ECC63|nr:phage tail sheath C-terminal domain-containing protein [Caulobacter endophyticus]MDG2527876.1 phage tail sheath subtilisin-like domain-containing protein [Caulobacter endophyticus]
MPVSPTYPGVYIEELPSAVRTVAGVPTAVTAFVGYTARGRDQRATTIFNFGDFERKFGGLAADSLLGYAVHQFFQNGGGQAVIVRTPKKDAVAAAITLRDGVNGPAKDSVTLTALSRGAWANAVVADVDHAGANDASSFNLTLTDLATGDSERFANLSIDKASPRFVETVINDEANGSAMVKAKVPAANAGGRPVATGLVGADFTFNAGAIQGLLNDKDYSLKLSASRPAGKIADRVVTIIKSGEALPTSIVALSRLVERRLNEDLGKALPGAAVRVGLSPSGAGLAITPDFSYELAPDGLDTQLTVADQVAGTLAMLKLGSPVSNNVGRYRLGKGATQAGQKAAVLGLDGVQLPQSAELIGSEAAFEGLYALEKTDIFNLLCIPDATRAQPGDPTALDTGLDPNAIYAAALAYCERRRALLLVDPPPSVRDAEKAVEWISGGLAVKGANAASYFPRVRLPDPLDNFNLRTFPPSGAVAGLFARTDAERGVWKAPAGTDAQLRGVRGLTYKLSDGENGLLNPLGLNCIRALPIYGTLSWGARTLVGADAQASQWKYVPVRRLALMIEESLFRGTQWVVFEPNDEPLWSQIRLNLTTFMHGLFRQGAFQGATPREAYLVKCDKETTTQADIDRGVVNIVVGFAPLKPAEFVIIKIQQLANQSAT